MVDPQSIYRDWAQRKTDEKDCEYNNKTRLFLCNDPSKNPYAEIPEISKFWEKMNPQSNN